jgi:hypothetical protein
VGEPREPADRGGRLSAFRGALAATAVAVCFATVALAAPSGGVPADSSLHSCFWEGPISMKAPSSRGFDGHNFNYPESSATYWLARFRLPEGSKLFLRGRYAHARYESINSYSSGEPTDSLPDVETAPLPGSLNPFVAGHRRDGRHRLYRVEVRDAVPPAEGQPRDPNTLYARPAGDAAIELLYRVYEPDRGLRLAGGGGLPKPELRLADGSLARGAAVCGAINDPDRSIPVITTPEAQWAIATHAPGCDPAKGPAVDPPRWKRFFNLDYARAGFALGCTEEAEQAHEQIPHEDRGGFYGNRDIRYLYAPISRGYGPVLVVQAKLPTFPQTYGGARRMGSGQVRFWSLCSTEGPITTRTEACLADRQVPLTKKRRFRIVVSRPEDRPSNATSRCGVAWLRWALRGDTAGNRDFGFLIIRNMLPAPGFAQAIQRIEKSGTEAQVMGDYFPRGTYTSKADFEKLGCPVKRPAG